MKQLEVFNKIGGILKELNDQYKYIEATPENINELELELFVANAHFLADHAEILNKINLKNKAAIPVEPKAETSNNERYFEPVVQKGGPKSPVENISDDQTPSIDLFSNAEKDTYSFIREEPEVIRHELVIDDADWEDDINEEKDQPTGESIIIEEPVADEIVEEKPSVLEEVKKEKQPVAEEKVEEPVKAEEPVPPVTVQEAKPVVAQDEILTINQKISSQLGATNTVGGQAGTQPIGNLKSAISLNDKLLYIKDLFRGYSLAYSEAIEILNRFTTFEEAEHFLTKNYVVKNEWESKPETTGKFYALLRRKYTN
jgi:hypothetical protein